MFVSANGQVFQGEFIDDRPVKCPARQGAAVKAKMQRATGTRRHSATSEQLNKTNFTQFTFCCSILL